MTLKFQGQYPGNWNEIAYTTKQAAGWRCIRCFKANNEPGHTLTVHHWDGNRSNCRWWNLLALCQKCHLRIQAKVHPDRPWVWTHSGWFQPYVAGYYAYRYFGQDLSREEVMRNLNLFLSLEAKEVLGTDPLPLEIKDA